jgi:hypothetical protein
MSGKIGLSLDLRGMTLLEICKAYPEQVAEAIEKLGNEEPPKWEEVWNHLCQLPVPPVEVLLCNPVEYYAKEVYNFMISAAKSCK